MSRGSWQNKNCRYFLGKIEKKTKLCVSEKENLVVSA
jgi:hypothetical protein